MNFSIATLPLGHIGCGRGNTFSGQELCWKKVLDEAMRGAPELPVSAGGDDALCQLGSRYMLIQVQWGMSRSEEHGPYERRKLLGWPRSLWELLRWAWLSGVPLRGQGESVAVRKWLTETAQRVKFRNPAWAEISRPVTALWSLCVILSLVIHLSPLLDDIFQPSPMGRK